MEHQKFVMFPIDASAAMRFAGDTYVLRAHPWLGAGQIMHS